MSALLDRRAFIEENTRLIRPPLAPHLTLHLADEAVALWQKTEEELGEIGPAAAVLGVRLGGRAGAGEVPRGAPGDGRGQARARLRLRLGLVAIAAAKAGAARVEASEIDDFALTAIAMNARENGVEIALRAGDLIGARRGLGRRARGRHLLPARHGGGGDRLAAGRSPRAGPRR